MIAPSRRFTPDEATRRRMRTAWVEDADRSITQIARDFGVSVVALERECKGLPRARVLVVSVNSERAARCRRG